MFMPIAFGGVILQIDVLLKIAGIGLLVTAICQVLTRAGREEIATLATVAGILLSGRAKTPQP